MTQFDHSVNVGDGKRYVKMVFPVEGEPEVSSESMWSDVLADGCYQLKNIPAWVSGLSLEAGGDDEWATEFAADGVIEGPDMSDLASLYGRTWDRTSADIARNLYLVARTVATFGRASERAWPNPLPLCAGFHDQSVVFRIVEQS